MLNVNHDIELLQKTLLLSCIACHSNLFCPKMVLIAREQQCQREGSDSVSLLLICEIVPYKMAPSVYFLLNGIIFLSRSSVGTWRRSNSCKFRSVHVQILTYKSDTERFLTTNSGRFLRPFARQVKASCSRAAFLPPHRAFHLTEPILPGGIITFGHIQQNSFWLLLRLTWKKRIEGLNVSSMALQLRVKAVIYWSRAGWGWRRVVWNVCVSVRPRGKPTASVKGGGGQAGLKWRKAEWWPQPRLEVELCDRALSAGVRVLAVDALAVALHLGQVFVEDLARSQRRHQVVKLAAVVLPVGLCFPCLSLPLPLFLELCEQRRTYVCWSLNCFD